MNVVFISPHFPPQYEHFAAALRDRGATVLGVGDAPEESLTTSLRGALASYYFVPNMTDRDAMVRALGLLTHRFGKIDRIESLNEHWLEQEAALRDDFNVFRTARGRDAPVEKQGRHARRLPRTRHSVHRG
ncbi:MAG: hypothetical protein M5R36_23680 [Deltaproteobacteria bacterium]|nr:hypothetical protein [Deltaproteobacteria bacterium]